MLHFGDVAVLPLVVHVYCVSADLYVAMYPCCYLYESFNIMYLAAYAMNWLLIVCKLCSLLAIITTRACAGVK